jgi:hypothetical protein
MRNILIILIATLITCSAFLAGKNSNMAKPGTSPGKENLSSQIRKRQLNFFDAKKVLDKYEKNKKAHGKETSGSSKSPAQRKSYIYAKF